jgi:hypothetical protein
VRPPTSLRRISNTTAWQSIRRARKTTPSGCSTTCAPPTRTHRHRLVVVSLLLLPPPPPLPLLPWMIDVSGWGWRPAGSKSEKADDTLREPVGVLPLRDGDRDDRVDEASEPVHACVRACVRSFVCSCVRACGRCVDRHSVGDALRGPSQCWGHAQTPAHTTRHV